MKKLFLLLHFAFYILQLQGQNVGIGTATPGAKLHIVYGNSGYTGNYFPGAVVEGNGNIYLNLLTPNLNETGLLFGKVSDISHGGIVYNNSNTLNGLQFRTNGNLSRMVINQLGNVGIGNINPYYNLDVNNRMRIRSGGNNATSAGLWLNNNANTEAAFIGMEDDTHVGFYGNNAAGWKFGMNTQTGALKINGAEGSSGQLLRSNGTGQSAAWSNPLNALYNNMNEYSEIGTVTPGPNTYVTVPGITNISLVIGARSKVIFSSSLDVKSDPCFGCGGSTAEITVSIQYPGGLTKSAGEARGNLSSDETLTFVTANRIYTLDAGTYTITFYLENKNLSGPTVTGSNGRLDIIVIPE